MERLLQMPIHLTPLSRRSFLRRTLTVGAGLFTLPVFRALARSADAHRFALLSDTHIAGDATKVLREVNMAAHLKTAVQQIGALEVQPAGVFINGDCALDRGLAEDYATYVDLLKPLSEAKTPIHATMGNHDDREVFWAAVKESKAPSLPVASKHISVIETPRANWFLLDSLIVTKQTPGELGEEQRAWLSAALDAKKDKPALLMVHHNPVAPDPAHMKNGLQDADELFSIVAPRRHVKAVFYGHTHKWQITERDGVHLVNLPAVAYPFAKTDVTGWVDATLREDGIALTVRATDPRHPQHGQKTELNWRS